MFYNIRRSRAQTYLLQMLRRTKERARRKAREAKRTTRLSRRSNRTEGTTTGMPQKATRLVAEKGRPRGRGTETRRRTRGKGRMLMEGKRPPRRVLMVPKRVAAARARLRRVTRRSPATPLGL